MATVVKRVKTLYFLSVHRVKTCENETKTKQFFQTASTLTAYKIREKTIQLTHFKRNFRQKSRPRFFTKGHEKIPSRHNRSTDYTNPLTYDPLFTLHVLVERNKIQNDNACCAYGFTVLLQYLRSHHPPGFCGLYFGGHRCTC